MNRRDTVIIAAVLNCALLGALFITAKRSEEKNLEIPASAFRAPIVEVSPNAEGTSTGGGNGELVRQFMEEPVVIAKVPEVSSPGVPSAPSNTKPQEGTSKTQGQVSNVGSTTVMANKESANVPSVEVMKRDGAVSQEKAEQFITIVVKKGDFLERIAKANGTTVNAIMKLNNLTSTQLKIGQLLRVPEPKEEKR